MRYILVIALLALTACEDNRPFMTVECYDKMDKIVYRERLHEFTIQAAKPSPKIQVHTCIVTGDDQ